MSDRAAYYREYHARRKADPEYVERKRQQANKYWRTVLKPERQRRSAERRTRTLAKRAAAYEAAEIVRRSRELRKELVDSAMLALYNSGCSDTEIARQMGCERRTVAKWRYGSGLSHHDVPKVMNPLAEKIVKLVKAGLSYGEAAAELGITRNTVAGIVFRHGKAA